MVAAIILSAGASSRMGRNKAVLARPDGLSFLGSLASTLHDAGCGPIVAVAGEQPDAIRRIVRRERLPVVVVVNPSPSRGQLSSLLVALDWLDHVAPDAVLVTPVDLPLMASESVRRLVSEWRLAGSAIARPTWLDRHGHPVLFAARVFPELRATDPAEGARAVVRAHPDTLDVPIEDPGCFDDIDTPADYERVFKVPIR